MKIIELPDFAKELLKKQQCPYCKHHYEQVDVTAAGLRRSKTDHRVYYSYEVECPSCKSTAMTLVTSRPCDIYDLAIMLAELHESRRANSGDRRPSLFRVPKKSRRRLTSRISDEEIAGVRKILHDAATHTDFLLKIGMTRKEIKELCEPEGSNDQ